MKNPDPPAEKLKSTVREKYAQIAKAVRSTSCCGTPAESTPSSCCCGGGENPGFSYTFMEDDYAKLPGYRPEADLGLGCGLPTELALIRKGDTVVDLGSGAGNDAFVARRETGEKGRVIGVDMTPEMITLARKNNQKLGYENVEFLLGEIEALPVRDDTADVVVSNCVLNLVPDKAKAFREIHRILKGGGHFNVSDIVLKGAIPARLRKEAELYVGCVSGAVQIDEYLELIAQAGFVNVKVQKERPVEVPREVLLKYLSEKEVREMRNKGVGAFSVTVWGEKP